MESNKLIFNTSKALQSDVFKHLMDCNDSFYPPLNERVDVAAYANKIVTKAITFEAWSGKVLVGLIAIYVGEGTPKLNFITNVSVLPTYTGSGIASQLLKNCIDYSVDNKCFEIYLEVNKDNNPAISFYKKFNFVQSGIKNDNLVMKLALNN